MIRVTLLSNAKCVDGTPVPFHFYNNDVYIIQKTHRSYIIRSQNYEVEVPHEAIKEIFYG